MNAHDIIAEVLAGDMKLAGDVLAALYDAGYRVTPDPRVPSLVPWRCDVCGFTVSHPADVTSVDCPRCIKDRPMKRVKPQQLALTRAAAWAEDVDPGAVL